MRRKRVKEEGMKSRDHKTRDNKKKLGQTEKLSE